MKTFWSAKRFFISASLWMGMAIPIVAQKAPELGYVFPPAVAPGKTHEVMLGGYDFTGDMQFFVYDQQIKLETNGKPGRFLVPEPPYWFGEKGRSAALPIPREIPAKLTIAKKRNPGLVHWQVANANGSSATAVFYVSDINEIVEDRFRNEPQRLEILPVGVSGRLSRIAEVDRYTVRAKEDGPITIELLARTLGSNFNGVLRVADEAGKVLADAADTTGSDISLTFNAKANCEYTVLLHDVDFRGNRAYVYRLAITPGPRIMATIPAMGKRGTTRDIEFVGIGIATGNNKLETVSRSVTFPIDGSSIRYRLKTPFGETTPFRIPLSNMDETVEENKNTVPTEVAVPAAITAQLANGPRDFVWDAKKGESYLIDAKSVAIGGRLDLSLEVISDAGKVVASNDDHAGFSDPSLMFQANSDGKFTCRVKDLSSAPRGRDSIFRLSIVRPDPGYRLVAPQQLSFPVGTKTSLKLTAQRTGGHKTAIPIRIAGLPQGITAPLQQNLVIPEGKSDLTIQLQCKDYIAVKSSPIQIFGQIVGEPKVFAAAPAAGNLCPSDVSANRTNQILITTTLKPKFSVELVDKNRQRAVHRGTTYPAPFIIKRDEGFDGRIFLQMLAKQGRHRQGIDAPILPVPAGVSEALYPCYMPEWLETDRTTRMVVLGVGLQKDPVGNIREVTKQADARITMILEGALLQVSHAAKELTVNAGDQFEIPVSVSRSAKLPAPVSIQLVVPDELKKHVQMASQNTEIPPSQKSVRLRVLTSKNSAVRGRWPLTIRATALQDDRWLVVSQTELTVQFDFDSATNAGE